MAHINLFAVLQNLVELCKFDESSKELIEDQQITIGFTIKNGPYARLIFDKGKCSFTRKHGKSNIKLYFKSPEHFNQMIEGTANPIPLKGFTHLKFLTKDFMILTEKLSYYLRSNEELLNNPTYFKINTYLSAYAAFYALGEIGNTDPIGKMNAGRIPNGNIMVAVEKGPTLYIEAKDGKLKVKKGIPKQYRASMTFKNLETANNILNGKIDSYSCIATGDLQMKGFIPMLDNMNKLLAQVPFYLS